MIIHGQHFQTIWTDPQNPGIVRVIDQQKLPFEVSIKTLRTFDDAFGCIRDMTVRGAPLIGVTAAYGIYLSLFVYRSEETLIDYLIGIYNKMKTARPTAINLAYAVGEMQNALSDVENVDSAKQIALQKANDLLQSEIDACSAIGDYGLSIIEEIYQRKNGEAVNILTHCNAGWLACIDWGTATAPIYKAQLKGIPVHVWVDETRPRNQGSKLTAFELLQQGVPHTVIPDNTGGHLMQHGKVDMVIVGCDRATRSGDVCNKIGTYLKALAAADNNIPFYVALPTSSFDLTISDGLTEIPIEERDAEEVVFAHGEQGKTRLVPYGSPVANYGFDVTPARLITALITEKGICEPMVEEVERLFCHKVLI